MRAHEYVDGIGEYCGRCNAPKGNRWHSDIAPGDIELNDEAQLIDSVLRGMVDAGAPFSLNDCRHKLTRVTRKNLIGDRVRSFQKARLIEHTGDFIASTDRGTHGHPIKVWKPLVSKGGRP